MILEARITLWLFKGHQTSGTLERIACSLMHNGGWVQVTVMVTERNCCFLGAMRQKPRDAQERAELSSAGM